MKVSEYAQLDGWALAELIRGGEVTATEVYGACLKALDLVLPEINSAAMPPFDEPLEYDPEGFFAGTPFGLKDEFCHAKGIPQRLGSRLTGPKGLIFDHDHLLMSRFREAGLATAVLTTIPEMAYANNTESILNGSTRNPWDTERSVGGSSGGSCATVASGAVPIAYANDGGGSIRIPASYNGLVGLKPTRGLVSMGPDVQEVATAFVSEFAVTRSVRDTAALLDAVAGWVPGEKYRVQAPARPYKDELGDDPRGLRVAVVTESWAGSSIDGDVVATVEATAEQLSALGHQVEHASPVFSWEEFLLVVDRVWAAGMAEGVHGVSQMSGLEPGPDTLESSVLNAYRRGLRLTVLEMAETADIINRISRMVGEFFTRYDLILSPTTNTPALPLGYINPNDSSLDHEAWTRHLFETITFTPLFNLTGSPAVTLPLGMSETGLPIGAQLAADHCSDGLLIAVASQLEEAMPWRERRPAVHASNYPGD